jgi:hypothetical protein
LNGIIALIIFAAIALLFVTAVRRLLEMIGSRPPASHSLPYRRKDYLLSVAERSFYEALRVALADRAVIFAKGRLADLVWLPKGTAGRQSHVNRVQSKHVDFVLCEEANLRPLLVIELDDTSHDAPDRAARDAFVDAALEAAGLPVLHVRAQRGSATSELRAAIEAALGTIPVPIAARPMK